MTFVFDLLLDLTDRVEELIHLLFSQCWVRRMERKHTRA